MDNAPQLHSDPEERTPVLRPLEPVAAEPEPPVRPLPVVDPQRYLIEGTVAEGGQGRVLRARDQHLERTVALKELLASDSSLEARFLTEARITARLQHPAIVPIYEAGCWPGGKPFYVMKLVSGRSLAQLLRESAQTLDERLALLPHVLAVADAVAYAHGQRIIHRDLKPSNVLVGEFGETLVIDWGLAEELEHTLPPGPAPPSHSARQTSLVMGTPAYMPPEQAAGRRVDERADVYALGAILYYLLAAQPPYSGAEPREVLKRVLESGPVPLGELQPGVPEELLAIVSCAMSREPAWRYPSARELAEDLRRFLAGQLVQAHRYTLWERVQRLARRHRAALAVAALAVVALVAGVGSQYRRLLRERNRAEQAQRQAEWAQQEAELSQQEAVARADSLTLLQARSEVVHSPAQALEWLGSLSGRFNHWGEARTLAADAWARLRTAGLALHLRGHSRTINCAAFSPDGRWLVTASDDRTVRLWATDSGSSEVIATQGDEVWHSAFSPDGRQVALAGKDGSLWLWELATRTRRELRGAGGEPVRVVLFSPTGQRLYACDRRGELWEWEVASGRGRRLGTQEGRFMDMVLLPGGRYLATVNRGHPEAWLWDLERGVRAQRVRTGDTFQSLAAAPGGEELALGGVGGRVVLWHWESGRLRELELPGGPVSAVAYSADGRWLAAQSSAGPVLLWEREGSRRRLLESVPGVLRALTFSAEGRWLAAAGKDGRARLWEVESGQVRLLPGAEGMVTSVAFSPGGRWLAVGGDEGELRLYAPAARHVRVLPVHRGPVAAVALSADGRRVLSAGQEDGEVCSTPLEGGEPVRVLAHAGGVSAARALGDGSRLVTAGADGTVALWSGEGRLLQRLRGPEGRVGVLALSARGEQVAAGAADGSVWLWGADSSRGRRLGQHPGAVLALAFSPDGGRLASGGEEGELRLWPVAGGEGRVLYRHAEGVQVVAFSAQGQHLASGSRDHTLWLQPLEAGAGRLLQVGGWGVLDVRFSADGSELLCANMSDLTLQRWEVETGRLLGRLRGHTDHALRLALSPEGRRLASASEDGTVRLWDLESGQSRGLEGHEGPVLQVAFSADGRQVVSAGVDGTLRVWPDDLPLEPEPLREWLRQGGHR